MKETITLPEGVQATLTEGTLTITSEKGSINRQVRRPNIQTQTTGNTVTFNCDKATQREKRHIFTLRSHVNNMIKGVTEGHTYKLKVCSGHFPMNVNISNNELVVKNFLGEAVPRRIKLKQGAETKIDGDIITVTSTDKELAGHQASDIEQLTRITNRDRRIFQDGLYIIEKDGKVL